MARKKTEDHVLRKVFDEIYTEVDNLQKIDTNNLKYRIKRAARVNRRIMGMSLVVTAVAIFLVAFVYGAQAVVDYTAWVNRPSFADRLAAPYALESKLPPFLLNAVSVDAEVENLMTLNTANIRLYDSNEAPNASQLLSQVIQLDSIVPAQMGDYTLQWSRVQSTLLAQCLLFTGAEEQGQCKTEHSAEYIEPANFVDGQGNTISLVMAKYADEDQSAATIDAIYDYARGIGRIGNFSFSDMLNVDYFYSFTRKATSFTWVSKNWVITVSADDKHAIDAFMETFPLYENNPNLSNFPVIQITQNVAPAVVEVTEESSEILDSVSGTG